MIQYAIISSELALRFFLTGRFDEPWYMLWYFVICKISRNIIVANAYLGFENIYDELDLWELEW